MKGEYVEPHQHKSSQGMFSKLNPFSHHFQLSEDEDNRSNTTPTTSAQPHKPNPKDPGSNDGATIEVVRRPRGRPPGSKNKPKPPVIITRDPEPAMTPFLLEVPGANDVVDALSRFSLRRNLGLCVLTGSGTVANVTLRQPSATPGATITFHGRFDILSINATFLPQTTLHPSPNIFTISLAGPQGQIVGGAVAGGLMAAGPVFLIASSFNNPSYHRLPPKEEAGNSVSGGGGGGDGHSPPVSSGGGVSGTPGDQSCGMSVYSCNLGTDVIWAPTARPPPPPPPY
ncbi:AT-hook motif nuclear-localized protein 17-like [Tripterygium wilfordii]|uniref:AT-hook motif nuclear-localized protein 17-like n=1 Tax=Tripterygium wilfordii TaxID=458696 RepID=UPI0018F86461|nr:AT-hook motif nuclear-localized protein 17-like [Tripterygium wilfordii]XP_038705018.1 AT-hook motif nuclear-localized protein 17-like [Tripterygium wilfordii]